MSKRDIYEETKFVDLPNEELKEFLLGRYESIKNLEEKKRKDEKIAKLKEELQEYTSSVYTNSIKLYKAQLKAARALAKSRGIEFKLPKEALNDD